MSFLEVDHVTKRFGNLLAVDDVSMTVEFGELRAVIGPNGAGKTTFFNLISGFVRPDAGRIVLDGHDVTDLPSGAGGSGGASLAHFRSPRSFRG